MEKVPVLLLSLFFALSLLLARAGAENDLYSNADLTLENGVSWTFYKRTCLKLESMDTIQAARLLRLHFHDCFIQGCDASVVLDGSANLMLRGKAFEDVDKACDALVSCTPMSPITALATRDSVSRAFVRASHAACRKSSAVFLVPANKKFVVNKLLFQGSCQLGFKSKVCGMITATQNPESGENASKWLQSAKVESFTVVCKCPIDGQGENLWASQYKNRQQTSVSTMDRVFEGRTLLEPPEPKPDPGHAAHHH